MTAASTAAPVALRPSAAGIALVKSFEACRLTAYLPTPKDRPTIGWGAAGPDVRLGMCWTQAQCDARFVSDLDACAADVCRELGAVATTQGQFDAIRDRPFRPGRADKVFQRFGAVHHVGVVLDVRWADEFPHAVRAPSLQDRAVHIEADPLVRGDRRVVAVQQSFLVGRHDGRRIAR